MQTVEQHVYEALSPYQAPASKQESLYAQLGSYNIRNISRENLEYVINYLMRIIVCLHACLYYRFVSRLGTGQFGKVNKAVWTDGDEETEEVAVKTLTDSANTVKFLQEAAIMAQFKHPNILTLHGVVSAGEPVSSDTICNIYYQCSLIEDDCVGANAQWRAEISRDRNETNVCIIIILQNQIHCIIPTMQVRAAINAECSIETNGLLQRSGSGSPLPLVQGICPQRLGCQEHTGLTELHLQGKCNMYGCCQGVSLMLYITDI